MNITCFWHFFSLGLSAVSEALVQPGLLPVALPWPGMLSMGSLQPGEKFYLFQNSPFCCSEIYCPFREACVPCWSPQCTTVFFHTADDIFCHPVSALMAYTEDLLSWVAQSLTFFDFNFQSCPIDSTRKLLAVRGYLSLSHTKYTLIFPLNHCSTYYYCFLSWLSSALSHWNAGCYVSSKRW